MSRPQMSITVDPELQRVFDCHLRGGESKAACLRRLAFLGARVEDQVSTIQTSITRTQEKIDHALEASVISESRRIADLHRAIEDKIAAFVSSIEEPFEQINQRLGSIDERLSAR